MEPLALSQGSPHRPPLTELTLALTQRSADLRQVLPEHLRAAVAALMRSVNAYYSNRIEGHDAHPVDRGRALQNDASEDSRTRDLQREAQAHLTVQQWIDAGGLPEGHAVTAGGLREIHRRFCEGLPEKLLWVEVSASRERHRIVPGALRARDVTVGDHVAISAGAVPRFLTRFEEVYARLRKTEPLLAAAAAHHRLLWIHPFLDGNGRVARLMTHAMLLGTLDTGAAWSLSRGLARRVADYQGHLSACDQSRRNDLDGRGNLSEEALASFTRFFLTTCLDEVAFMERLMEPQGLQQRILLWAQDEMRRGHLPAQAGAVLDAVLAGGAASLVDSGGEQARRAVAALIERGALIGADRSAPLRLTFPVALTSAWLPGLLP